MVMYNISWGIYPMHKQGGEYHNKMWLRQRTHIIHRILACHHAIRMAREYKLVLTHFFRVSMTKYSAPVSHYVAMYSISYVRHML